jgi:chemotaxis protein histidine kinase CheA/ActR/RegA family two-component response regulator
MNIDDLLGLLVAEYGAGLDDAKRALTSLVHDPDAPAGDATSLGDTSEFIARSLAAANLVNLVGLAQYLEHIGEVVVASSDRESTMRSVYAGWALDGLDVAAALIAAPNASETVELAMLHAGQSPLAPSAEWHDALAIALLQPPTIADDEDDALQYRFDPVTTADVSLTVDDADPELLSAMLADAPRQLERLYSDLTLFASTQSPTAGALAESQRIAHTLKGSGNIIGLPGIARIAHRLEDTLIWLDADRRRDPDSQMCAVRDALLASETLQQMVAHLAGDDLAPSHALAVLERMQAWAEWIYTGEEQTFAPPPVDLNAHRVEVSDSGEPRSDEAAADIPTVAQVATGSDRAALRVPSELVGKLLKRAGQSLANAQRTTQELRTIDDTLRLAQERQVALRARLNELQQTVDRQVVALQARRDEASEFDSLELDRYDALHLLARVVAEAVQDQVDLTSEVRQNTQRLVGEMRDEQRTLREQHRDLLNARLVAFSSLVPRLRRNVAQTSSILGKPARLVVEGEETTVDAEVLSSLTEPLLHLLRNAVDHGIEPTEQRVNSGKSTEATVRLRCVREGQFVRIELSDDGSGLDIDAIAARAREIGLLDDEQPLATEALTRLILQRGFSTKSEVTDISGRGLGLDIVNDRIKAMKGHLKISTIRGEGTTFSMRVPVSSGIAQSMILECAGERVAVSSEQVVIVLPPGSASADTEFVRWDEADVPIAPLANWLGFSDRAAPHTAESTFVIALGESGLLALAVDRVIEVRELVLQDLGGLLRRLSGLQTSALLDNGSPLFLLDIAALESRARRGVALSAALALQRRAAVSRTRVLVVDDALSARRAVEHVFEDQGYEVHSASDGFEALEVLRRWDIALVATDLEMPNLNGLELAKRMREVPAWSTIPVIMITSRGGERHRNAALSAGVHEYLVKPFSDQQLAQVAATQLRATRHAA